MNMKKTETLWAIKYNARQYPRQKGWLHRGTIRRTRAESIGAIMGMLSFWSSSWCKVKRDYCLSVVKVSIEEVAP